MQLSLSWKKGRLSATTTGGTGEIVSTTERAATNRENVGKIAAELELDADWFWKRYLEARNGATTPCEIPADAILKKDDPAATAPQADPLGLLVRGRLQPASEAARVEENADPIEAFKAALELGGNVAEPVIEWDGTDRLACLDVDFHGVEARFLPDEAALTGLLPHWQPTPAVAWLSHGRGFHGIFRDSQGWTAGELAAVSALTVIPRFPEASVEVKSTTRHPKHPRTKDDVVQNCGTIRHPFCAPGDPVRELRRQLLQQDPTDSDGKGEEYRLLRGFVPGTHYTHDRCPFGREGEENKGTNPPVQAFADGVHCYYCQKKGRRCNATYRELALSLTPSAVGDLAGKWVHWGHAQFTIPGLLGLPEPVAKRCYRAALRVTHGVANEDSRLAAALDSRNDLVRLDGYWATRFGEALTKEIDPLLAALPACQVEAPDPKIEGGKVIRVVPATISRFKQTIDLADYGFRSVTPIFGVRIATEHLETHDPRKPTAVFLPRALRERPEAHPRYIPGVKEAAIAKAWGTLQKSFPGLSRPYVELLIAAKGFAEAQREKPPAVYVSGPSGAGKSAAVMVAAAICGDVCTDVVWHPQAERFRQGVMAAATQGSYCAINEAVKNGRAAGHAAVDVMDILLNFTEASVSHKLYVGAVPMGRLPVFVWTETDLPDDVRFDQQLSRRLVWVELPNRVRWEEPLLIHGVDRPDRVRLAGPEFVEACNAILSDVIDRFFKERRSFESVARELGFLPMEAASEQTVKSMLSEFYQIVQASPRLDSTHYGGGWVFIEVGGEGRLAKVWRELAESDGYSSRLCRAQDWGRILGVPMKYQERKDGRGVAVRFSTGADPVQLEPGPVADGPDRPGNAVGGGHSLRSDPLLGTPFDPSTLFGREASNPVGDLDPAGPGSEVPFGV